MKPTMLGTCVPTICLAAVFIAAPPALKPRLNTCDQKAAAAYFDQRAGWWMELSVAARDQETLRLSCFTAVPYALSYSKLWDHEGQRLRNSY